MVEEMVFVHENRMQLALVHAKADAIEAGRREKLLRAAAFDIVGDDATLELSAAGRRWSGTQEFRELALEATKAYTNAAIAFVVLGPNYIEAADRSIQKGLETIVRYPFSAVNSHELMHFTRLMDVAKEVKVAKMIKLQEDLEDSKR